MPLELKTKRLTIIKKTCLDEHETKTVPQKGQVHKKIFYKYFLYLKCKVMKQLTCTGPMYYLYPL